MVIRLLSKLTLRISRLKRRGGHAGVRPAGPAPLDPVERLHRGGMTFPVMMEFSRSGW